MKKFSMVTYYTRSKEYFHDKVNISSKQCDQMLKKIVVQIFQKLPKKVTTVFFLKVPFPNSTKIL